MLEKLESGTEKSVNVLKDASERHLKNIKKLEPVEKIKQLATKRILEVALMIGIGSFAVGCDNQLQSSNKPNLETAKPSPVENIVNTPEVKLRVLKEEPTKPKSSELEVSCLTVQPQLPVGKFDPKNPSGLLPPPPTGETVEERAEKAFGKDSEANVKKGISRVDFNILVENKVKLKMDEYLKIIKAETNNETPDPNQMVEEITEKDKEVKKLYDRESYKQYKKVTEELLQQYSPYDITQEKNLGC